MPVSIDDIKAAAQVIDGHILRTPAVRSPRLSEELNCDLVLKLENLQATGSFKERGAINKLSSLTAAERKKGVIAMSAGNHAQGVAYHAQRMGIPATIVMPDFAPITKVERTRSFGARVVLNGDTLDASAVAARQIAKDEGLTFVHPYDDELVVAGQGTIGLELMEDHPDLEIIVVPIGGGGIVSGIATAAKAIKPSIRIIGVEAEFYPSMYQAIHNLNPISGGQTLADGIAVKNPGTVTRRIIENLVEDIILVDESAIESAILALAEKQKVVAEGAGAAGIAAIQAHPQRFAGKKVATIICGGNIDVRILSAVLTRGLVRDGRMARLRIDISDRPGVLAKLAGIIGDAGGNIIEVNHQRLFQDVPVRNAEIDIIIETRNADHVKEIVASMQSAGFRTRVLSTRSIDEPVR
ncbi:threonine ammonia-lyase [Limibacillus halophilus]|uniref:Threonine dehydratase n=1 Tax=Limibacillus halophilus TaxID=1579333 RepID=A0A839SXG7_9PROT|nr:threonine ammonia-lyase [Limibacillus halophilus]MBB3065705.1 threonine dehydratase [Limibacillus halophilus]